MDKKKDNKEVELKYEFDRLGSKKLSLVYRLLIPLSAGAGDNYMVQIDNEHRLKGFLNKKKSGQTSK